MMRVRTPAATPTSSSTTSPPLPNARLCFDIAHAKAVDASLDEDRAILDRFASRLSHVHLSSLDDRHKHVPLTPEDQSLFSGLLSRCPDVPWILDAPPI